LPVAMLVSSLSLSVSGAPALTPDSSSIMAVSAQPLEKVKRVQHPASSVA
jgi:hypothetical protein